MRLATSTLSLCLLVLPAGAATNDTTPELPKEVTFSEHVAPVIHENCASCHRPGDIAPMSLRTYDEVRPWAKSIRRAVEDGTMPPWHADPEYGVFANDRSLNDYERELISKWVKQGAKVGDAAAVDAVAEIGPGYRLGEPDEEIVFEEVSLPAGGTRCVP